MRRAVSEGFTLIEILVAIIFLTIVAVAMGLAVQHAARTLVRSRVELAATQFLTSEIERIRVMPLDSLRDHARTVPNGDAVWTVRDSAEFVLARGVVRFGTPMSGMLTDTVAMVRIR